MNERCGLRRYLLVLQCQRNGRGPERQKGPFAPYVIVTPTFNKVDRSFSLVNVRRFISDEKNYTVTDRTSTEDSLNVKQWYVVEILRLLIGDTFLVGAYLAVHTLTGKHTCNKHIFYVIWLSEPFTVGVRRAEVEHKNWYNYLLPFHEHCCVF